MTIPRLLGFADYWRETPPVNESVAAIFKAKDTGSSSSTTFSSEAPPEELLMMHPQRATPPPWLLAMKKAEKAQQP